jgi:putative ABC transport system ATP-binding protein
MLKPANTAPSNSEMLTTSNLIKTVQTGDGDLTILKGINLEIKAAERVAIVGPSGSGKSTLLGLLAGLDTPSSGAICWDGRDITTMTEDQRAALRGQWVGFVFQSFQLLPSLSALENVMLPMELVGKSDARELAEGFLQRVGLSHRLKHYPRQLSGGEQQRVAIARAFASTPKILFADEPTGNLDVKTGEQIIDLLFDLNQQAGTTLILVSHDQKLADRCDRVLQLDEGMLVNARHAAPMSVHLEPISLSAANDLSA